MRAAFAAGVAPGSLAARKSDFSRNIVPFEMRMRFTRERGRLKPALLSFGARHEDCHPPRSACSVSRVGPPSTPVPVVCAVIERDGLVLLAQRPPQKLLPLKWEFAGGKVEPGEDAAVAIVREIREELGCEIVVHRALPPFTYDYGRVVIEMLPFVCTLAPGTCEPHPHEHVAIAWVKPEELTTYDLAAADFPVIEAWRRLGAS